MKSDQTYTCANCGTEHHIFFCPRCGQITEYPDFVADSETRRAALQSFVQQLISAAAREQADITALVDSSNLKDAFFRHYYERIAFLQKMCLHKTTRDYFLNDGSTLFEKMNAFADKCRNNECQIAVVGTVKAGKSALINALLGREIASSYPTPETASLTKFRKSSSGNYVKVTFYSQHEWQQLWQSVLDSRKDSFRDDKEDFITLYEQLDAEKLRSELTGTESLTITTKSHEELKEAVDRYTSSRFAEHFFAKEVEIGLYDFFAPDHVVIVDTPGLNDPVSYRTDITRRYLRQANVVLLCIRSNTAEITSTELEQLSYVFAELRYSKDRIITVGTQIDHQPEMIEYWEKYTLPEYLKYLSTEPYYGSTENAINHIVPVTAYYYMLINKVINNPDILKSIDADAKKIKNRLREIVQRTYDCPTLEDLELEYGEEEAVRHFKSPLAIFSENRHDLMERTRIPHLRQILLDGPIARANEIILDDIREDFVPLCATIRKTAKDISAMHRQTIQTSKSADIASQIHVLEETIRTEKSLNIQRAKELSDIMIQLESATRQAIDKIKN